MYKLALRGLGVLNSEGPKATGEAWLCRKLNQKMQVRTVVDVGANLDIFGISEFSRANIYACEPHPETFLKMRQEFAAKIKRGYLHLINIALSDHSGTANLWDFADDAALKHTQPTSTLSSLQKAVIEDIHKQKAQSYKVKVTTLDALASSLNIQHIDILKIDTEGNELKVLVGGRNMLRRKKVEVILFEFNEMNVISRTFFYDFVKLLPDYRFFRLLPSGLISITEYRPITHEIFGFQNILCVRKELSEKFNLEK
ncbi:MAG: FkbM family methyltransferase [Candidatus Woesebacteria bacterium]|nr:FkbM family methyltransferase [Candidatus Woesebacteria bacterium]